MTACDTDATHTRPTTHDAHTKSTPSLNPFPSPSAVTESFHGIDPLGGFPKEDLKDVKDKTEKDKKDTTPAKHPSRVDTTPLEGVHALACAIIAANHWSLWYGEKKHGAIELQGGFAVTVFFFITGFVMFLAYGNKACREDFEYWVCLGRFGECLSRDSIYPEVIPIFASPIRPERDFESTFCMGFLATLFGNLSLTYPQTIPNPRTSSSATMCA